MSETRPEDQVTQGLLDTFHSDLALGLKQLDGLENIEVVVGIPFGYRTENLTDVIHVIEQGLEEAGLNGRSIVLFVGSDGNSASMTAAREAGDRVAAYGFSLGRDLEGRGWSTRAIMEVTSRLGASLLIVRSDLMPQTDRPTALGDGFGPAWISALLDPVCKHGHDLALARFSRHPLFNVVESLLTSPLITGVFGHYLNQPTPSVFALSLKLIRACLAAEESWTKDVATHGLDPWLTTRALVTQSSICEVPLGLPSFEPVLKQLKLTFFQVTRALFDQIKTQSEWWQQRPAPIARPVVYGLSAGTDPPTIEFDPNDLHRRFKLEFDHFDETLYSTIVPDELRLKMERLADRDNGDPGLTADEWASVVYDFLVSYRFEKQFHVDDIVDGVYPFFLARLGACMNDISQLKSRLIDHNDLPLDQIEGIISREIEHQCQLQTDRFVARWPQLCQAWREKEKDTSSYLPRLGAWEFVPHVGVVVPQEIRKSETESVWARKVYQRQIDRYRREFKTFITERLGLEEVTDSMEILDQLHRFMRKLDWTIDVDIFRGDFSTVRGARQLTEQICEVFAPKETLQLTPEATRGILHRIPPKNLIMQSNCQNVTDLLENQSANDALAMAGWTDRQHFLNRVLDLIEQDAEPGWFHHAPLKPLVVDLNLLTNAIDLRGTAALARLVGRVVVGNYEKGWGGEFPKLWFLLKTIKSIVGVELFAKMWAQFAEEGLDFNHRVAASIRGHWGRRVLSAHNVFENQHQRILASRLRGFAERIQQEQPERRDAAQMLIDAASVYHLSITLPDATFVPLSAWTWASYSHRGGVGAPTPLSSLVERDWATRDFLVSYLSESGQGDEHSVEEKIVELIGQGRESDDLSEQLLGLSTNPDQLMVSQSPSPAPLGAGQLVRLGDGPILKPRAGQAWESRYVLNNAAVRLDGTIYLLYRAFGEDKTSRIGLAWTKDGVHIDGRLDQPIFSPDHPTESAGCEDPRVTVIGERMYMLYSAWDGELPQIAMASIPVQAFLEQRFDAWERHGLGFPGLSNKDATLYPDTFDGRYVLYHRIDPNMWISYLDELNCPWPKTGQQIVVGPRSGMMWDGVKIGAGAQPIKTTHGWLNIYHGVDYAHCYRLGVLFTHLDNPAKVLYQSPNPILEPLTDFEIGKTGGKDYWVPHVVFTCGAVPLADKEIIDRDDEILVYYGAADTAIGVAKAKLSELVPIL